MSYSINTNIASMQAQEYLRVTSEFQSKTINRVTSGLRIISSGDDAAGLAIANSFRSDQAVLSQGIRNANDGLATLQTIDGGISNIGKLLDRARTLAAQSATGTFTGSRDVVNSEFQSVLSEIDRQAQSIGLNAGGSFAKNLSVFIGGGRALTTAGEISNGSVSVDLSSSTVDTKSLGLNAFRATGKSTVSLDENSTTGVAKVLAASDNTGDVAVAGFTDFYFTGAGFSDSSGANAIKVSVDYSAVDDTDSLATAVNAAIATAAEGTSDEAKAFKAAGITASIVTDSNGKQQLAFNSNGEVFQVRAGDRLANALLGNFADALNAVGKSAQPEAVAAQDFVAPGTQIDDVQLTIAGTALAGTVDILTTDDVDDVVSSINTQIAATGALDGKYEAVSLGNRIAIRNIQSGEAGMANFNVVADKLGTGFAAATTKSTYDITVNSGGAYQSVRYSDSKAFKFTALGAGDTQSVTISGTHSDGTQYDFEIALNNGNAGTLDDAIAAINSQLQVSGDPSLANMYAVREQIDADGAAGIRLLSSEAFSVTLGALAAKGLEDKSTGAVAQGVVVNSQESSGSGTLDISNANSARAAVVALEAAVTSLGNAQAVVGKGENQFSYAVSLASTQLTNLAASESRIRDADLAAEAANLTKAQILQQAGVAALAQANSAPQAVLSLLRG